MKKDYLLEYIKRENSNFNFNEFFKEENAKDNRAVIVITNDQIVKINNFDKKDKKLSHDESCDLIIRAIYNIMFDSTGKIIDSEEAERYIDFYKKQQTIALYMYNDSDIGFKLIWVYLPSKITSSQLSFLTNLEKENEVLFKSISKKMYEFNKDHLVGVSVFDDNTNTRSGESLKCVIDYIKQNNMINDKEQVLDDYNIIGNTLESSNNKLL